jgi:serine/threonine protein kinase
MGHPIAIGPLTDPKPVSKQNVMVMGIDPSARPRRATRAKVAQVEKLTDRPEPASALMPGNLGRYRIVKRLGVGGMAEVYLAILEGPRGFQKKVVVKRILPQLVRNDRLIEMFRHEAQVQARMSHPNIVQLFELGRHEREFFLALEYVDGISLEHLMIKAAEQGRPVPRAVIYQAMADACLGLHHAHTLADDEGKPYGLIHRDVTPDNLIMTRDGITRVLDFGIAKLRDSAGLTEKGELKGKISYMSPEYIRGEELDARSDLFSLGVTFYVLLTGEKPFGTGNVHDTVRKILEDEPVPPSIHDITLPPGADEVVMRLLQKEPQNRHPSALAVYEDIHRLMATYNGRKESLVYIRQIKSDTKVVTLEGQSEGVVSSQQDPHLAPMNEDTTAVDLSDLRLKTTKPAPPRRTWALAALLALAALVAALVLSGVIVVPMPGDGGGKGGGLAEDTVKGDAAQAPSPKTKDSASRAGADDKSANAGFPAGSEGDGAGDEAFQEPISLKVKGPKHVQWLLPGGDKLGEGSLRLNLPAGTGRIVAFDPKTTARTELLVGGEATIDYATLPRGRVAFRILPWAEVKIGEKELGSTPIPDFETVIGTYDVNLVWEDRVKTVRVDVRAGGESVLKQDMRKVPRP